MTWLPHHTRNLLDACPAAEAEGGLAQEGHHRRSPHLVQGPPPA